MAVEWMQVDRADRTGVPGRSCVYAALVLCWGVPAAVAQNTSEVSFQVVSQSGTPVSFEVRSFRRRIGGDEFANRFQGLSARDIPYGTYEYELRSVPDGVFKLSSSIAVSEPEVFLPLADIKPVFTMDGKVVGFRTAERLLKKPADFGH